MCPYCFSLSQMKNLGMTHELYSKADKITCPAFGLYSSPAEYSTMGHIVLDLTNLAYQPTTKSREQPGHSKRHVTFAMSERKTAYPAHAPDIHEDEDEDDKPHVRPASRKELAEARRDPATDDEDLLPLVHPRLPSTARKRKEPPLWQDPTASLEQKEGARAREQRIPRFLGRKSRGEATSHLTAYPCKSTSPSAVIAELHEWMGTFQMNPKEI